MTYAFVFPGQGSQAVGMGQELAAAFPAAAEVFEVIDDALGENLTKTMFEGPENVLMLTENAQPALMAVSLAVLSVLRKEGGFDLRSKVRYVAGHSLGEYSALAAAETFSLSDTAKLLKTRGRAMQEAVPVGKGAMAAILGLNLDIVRKIADEAAQGEICTSANDNANGQVVISGTKTAVERALLLAKDKGAKRGVQLPVSAPFHCALMAPASDAMAEALSLVRMKDPLVPLVANVTAGEVSDAAEIRRLLVEQVTGMVRWRESVLFMRANGVDRLIEIGSGKVLSGLARRIDSDLTSQSISTPEDVETFIKSF